MADKPDLQNETRLKEISSLFLRLGITAFGGPAAHIAMLYDEVVKRRRWMSDEHFLDLLGATNLIPGPNSTEMVIHTGYHRGGWRGIILAGVCFIAPAVIIVMALSWFYTRYSSLPQIQAVLYGIKPVMIIIVFQALLLLGKKAIRSYKAALLGTLILVTYLYIRNEILVLFIGGIAYWIIEQSKKLLQTIQFSALFSVSPLISYSAQSLPQISLVSIFFSFLKIGSVLYGSGYVLLAFLRSEFVVQNNWLTDQQLIDAIAIGQITPGPVFTTATFIGYLLAGPAGAIIATIGIFLPAFIFVAISIPLIPRIRNSKSISAILDGINISSLALMAAVLWNLGKNAISDPFTALVAVLSGILLFRYKLNTTWLVLIGVIAGILQSIF
jgi:chromate transporter